MTLAEAINVYFDPNYLQPVKPTERRIPTPEHRGDLSANTEAQYNALEWTDKRPKPKWAELVPIMALPSPKALMISKTVDARLTALEAKTASLE